MFSPFFFCISQFRPNWERPKPTTTVNFARKEARDFVRSADLKLPAHRGAFDLFFLLCGGGVCAPLPAGNLCPPWDD